MPRSLELDTLARNAKDVRKAQQDPTSLAPGAPATQPVDEERTTARYTDIPVQNTKDTLNEELTPVTTR